MASRSRHPLGRRFLAVVIGGSVLPLMVIGLWTTRSASRSGRMLLRAQLDAALEQTARDVEARWAARRSDLLVLAENEPVRVVLSNATGASETPAFVRRAWDQMTAFSHVVIRDHAGRARIVLETAPFSTSERTSSSSPDFRGIAVRLPVTDLATGDTIGSVEAQLRAAALLPGVSTTPAMDAPVTAIVLAGAPPLTPPMVDTRIFDDESVVWNERHWMTVRRHVVQPPLDLAIAGPVDPYVKPFARTAQSAALALLVATVGVLMFAIVITRRMSRDVERELAQREALAAVGEFASELAHEVRNPLTAVRLDLQRVNEVADDPESVHRIASRVLRQVERIDRAVTGALRVARGGATERRAVDLRVVLENARRTAQPEFDHRSARLALGTIRGQLELDGDTAALEQLFLNLLINAAQALSPAGMARIDAEHRDGTIEVTISDTGAGMSARQLAETEQPFRSSKRDGTGLGLKIARRIVQAHGGRIEIASTVGRGTCVTVTLPGSIDARPTLVSSGAERPAVAAAARQDRDRA
jgi:signal transduction histidine kinase